VVDNGGEVRAGRGACLGRVITVLGSPQGTQVVLGSSGQVLTDIRAGRCVSLPVTAAVPRDPGLTQGSEPGPGPEGP
jgi:hypothetical protein